MHVTPGLSPASGEMILDASMQLYGDGVDCGTYFALDHAVPESSHTVEIEYVYETDTLPNDKPKIAPESPPKQQRIDDDQEPKLTNLTPHKQQRIDDDQETDLTNLTWLQNITNIMSLPQFSIPPMSPNPQAKTPQSTRLQKFNDTITKCQKDFTDNKEEYRTNAEKKPPYSYSTLICVAMRYNEHKMTLSAIYSWIRENFKYYRNADPTWQNSIRHNLSLNKVFVKVARSKQEPGKGGFWKLDLAHLEGTKRISNRPKKKKKDPESPQKETEEVVAVANIPKPDNTLLNQTVTLHLPDYSLGQMQGLTEVVLEGNVGANVIVEPAIPPPLIPEEDLTSLLLNPTEWDDLQLDMLDNYLDSCFK